MSRRTTTGERGAEGLTVRAVIREVGVSHGAPRRYFPTSNALAAGVVARVGLGDLVAAPINAAQPKDSPRQALGGVADTYFSLAAQRAATFALVMRHHILAGPGEMCERPRARCPTH